MTTQSSRRFQAAVAAMSGLIPTLERQSFGDGEYGDYYIGARPPEEVASEALLYADALLKALDASEPKGNAGDLIKQWIKEDENCKHGESSVDAYGVRRCLQCNCALATDGKWA